MKKIYVCAVLALFTACDTESQGSTEIQPNPKPRLSKSIGYPANPNNSYDLAGRLFYDTTESYYLHNAVFPEVAAIIGGIELAASADADFVAVKPVDYLAPTANDVTYLLDLAPGSQDLFLNQCGLSATAKAKLSSFITDVLAYRAQHQSYGDIYNYILAFEAQITASASLTEFDKKTILITSATARYATYFASKYKRRPDRDWEISWGNIAAATEGSGEGLAKAVTLSAATAIAANR